MCKCQGKKIKYIVSLSLILLTIAALLYAVFVAYPLVTNVVTSSVSAMSSSVVADVADVFKESPEFLLSFVDYEKNAEGYVSVVKGNGYNINQANFLIQREMQRRLNELTTTEVNVPLGAFSGSTMLASYGPNVAVSIMPIGAVSCRFCSQFTSQAVNQTLHRMFIEVTTTISLVLPLKTVSIDTISEIFIGETVIVGQIPSTYFESGFDTNLLDLVP